MPRAAAAACACWCARCGAGRAISRLTPHGRAKALQHGARHRRHRPVDRKLHAVRRLRAGVPGENRPGRHDHGPAPRACRPPPLANLQTHGAKAARPAARSPCNACCCRARPAARNPGRWRGSPHCWAATMPARRRLGHRAGAGSRRGGSGATPGAISGAAAPAEKNRRRRRPVAALTCATGCRNRRSSASARR